MHNHITKPLVLFVALCLAVLCLSFSVSAEPKYQANSTFGPKLTGGVSDEFLEKARAEGNLGEKPLRLSAITDEDLRKVTSLKDILTGVEIDNAKELTDISPLGEMSNLTYVKLERLDKVTDLSPLGNLTKLKKLHIRQVPYESFDFLKPLDNLEELVFFMQPKQPSDISALAGKKNMKILHFYSAQITDISPLADSTELEDLSLYMTEAEDLSPLTAFPKLRRLSLYSVPAKDLSPVGELTELRSIWIYATKFEDYSPLAKLTKLEELHAGISHFDRMDVVRSMPNLRSVKLLRDKVTDFAPLAECKELREAVLEGMHVGDLSIFANATKLERLDLENSTVSNPEAIAALPALSALDLQKTEGVTDISIFKDLPKLKYIYSKKGQFPEEQLAPFEKKAVVQ